MEYQPKEQFGRDWGLFIKNLQDRKIRYEKQLSYYEQLIRKGTDDKQKLMETFKRLQILQSEIEADERLLQTPEHFIVTLDRYQFELDKHYSQNREMHSWIFVTRVIQNVLTQCNLIPF